MSDLIPSLAEHTRSTTEQLYQPTVNRLEAFGTSWLLASLPPSRSGP